MFGYALFSRFYSFRSLSLSVSLSLGVYSILRSILYVDLSETSHFWSRSRSRWEKRFRSGPGEKKILVPVPTGKIFRSRSPQKQIFRSRSRSPQKQILVPVTVKKIILVPIPVKKRNLVTGPGPLCPSLIICVYIVYETIMRWTFIFQKCILSIRNIQMPKKHFFFKVVT